MKCITWKSFLIILSIFFALSILITLILTHAYYKRLNSTDEIDYITDENLEDNPIQYENENEYIKLLQEKYAEKKILALTFDDGPSKYTHDLIDELNKRNIKVTFFVLGENIEKFPETLKFAIDSGNEIGIHSYKHKLFTKLNEEEIHEQINLTKNLIYDISPIEISYIRVPYGSINDRIKEVLNKENLTNVLWDVDSLDWKFKNKSKTYNYALKKIKGNDIILMHDTFKSSINAAISLIDKLTTEGYIFVTVSQLFELRNNYNSEKLT